MSAPLAALLPTTGLAPYATSFSLLAAPAQNLQQFPQHVSNAPGQTVDYFFNVISVLIGLNQTLINNESGAALTGYATNAISILTAITASVQTYFAGKFQWSSPILPYKGWAANNAVQASLNPINFTGLEQSLALAGAAKTILLSFVLYFYTYAFNKEVSLAGSQINYHTYEYLVNSPNVTVAGVPAPTTRSVTAWISYLESSLQTAITSTPGGLGTIFFGTSSATTLAPIQNTILDVITVATVETLEHIPLYYLMWPQPSSSSSATTYNNLQSEAAVILIIIFAGLLYNSFSAISPALEKVYSLYDPNTLQYIFDTASDNIKNAFTAFTPLVKALNSSATNGGTNGIGNPLTGQQFSYAITYTQKSARTTSVDINRIDGSLVPTLTRLLQVWQAVQALATYIAGKDNYTVANDQQWNQAFRYAISGIQGDTSISGYIQAAITSFGPTEKNQLGIHYSRWSQNLTNI